MLTLTDTDKMPFGKHQGKTMANVPAVYLMWLHNEGCNDEAVRRYISENFEAISLEAARARQFQQTQSRYYKKLPKR